MRPVIEPDDILDAAQLDELRQTYGDLVGGFIRLFVAETRARLERIGRLIEDSDRLALWREAHTLAGSAALFACDRLNRRAADLEDAALRNDRAAFAPTAAAAAEAFRRTEAELAACFSLSG